MEVPKRASLEGEYYGKEIVWSCTSNDRDENEVLPEPSGDDKVKFEMMRWAVSSVTKPSARREEKTETVEEEAPKKVMPKKLRKSSDAEEAPVVVEEVEKAAAEEASSEE